MKIFSAKGSPVTYVRITAIKIKPKGKKGDDYKTVNRQKRIDINILNKNDEMVSTFWYPLTGFNKQQFELNGPLKVRLYTRILENAGIVEKAMMEGEVVVKEKENTKKIQK